MEAAVTIITFKQIADDKMEVEKLVGCGGSCGRGLGEVFYERTGVDETADGWVQLHVGFHITTRRESLTNCWKYSKPRINRIPVDR